MEHTPADARFERIEAALENLPEVMRSMQTELLRGFAAFAEGQAARMKKLETYHAADVISGTMNPQTFGSARSKSE